MIGMAQHQRQSCRYRTASHHPQRFIFFKVAVRRYSCLHILPVLPIRGFSFEVEARPPGQSVLRPVNQGCQAQEGFREI